MRPRTLAWQCLTAVIGTGLTLLLLFGGVEADTSDSDILPPGSPHYGATYGEWSARWYQWALSQPTNVNPVLDLTGAFCGQGQSGNVWFLAGAFLEEEPVTVTRECTIPAGRALFFPVLNTAYIGFPTDPNDTPELALQTAQDDFTAMVGQSELAAEVDGTPVDEIEGYRASSPVFDIAFPPENPFGITEEQCPANADGEYVCTPNAADGTYLMLAPLSPGTHTVHFTASGLLDITYTLTVQEWRLMLPSISSWSTIAMAGFNMVDVLPEWTSGWWQFMEDVGYAPSDETGDVDCSAQQTGDVWYLATSDLAPGHSVTRNCQVPSRVALVAPVMAMAWANEGDETLTVEEKRQMLADMMSGVDPGSQGIKRCYLESTIDGEAVDMDGVQSPPFFMNPDPEAVSDGFWIAFQLEPGFHTIHYVGRLCESGTDTVLYESDITYNIISAP